MANIELARLNVVATDKIPVRGGQARSGTKVDGGFAIALSSHEKIGEMEVAADLGSSPSVSINQGEKQTFKVKPKKSEDSKEHNVLKVNDSDVPDIELEDNIIVPEVPIPKVLPCEVSLEGVAPSETQLSDDKFFQVVEMVDKADVSPVQNSGMFGFLRTNSDSSLQNRDVEDAPTASQEEDICGDNISKESPVEKTLKMHNSLLEGFSEINEAAKSSIQGHISEGENLEVEKNQFLTAAKNLESSDFSLQGADVLTQAENLTSINQAITASEIIVSEPAEHREIAQGRVTIKPDISAGHVTPSQSEQTVKITSNLNQGPAAKEVDESLSVLPSEVLVDNPEPAEHREVTQSRITAKSDILAGHVTPAQIEQIAKITSNLNQGPEAKEVDEYLSVLPSKVALGDSELVDGAKLVEDVESNLVKGSSSEKIIHVKDLAPKILNTETQQFTIIESGAFDPRVSEEVPGQIKNNFVSQVEKPSFQVRVSASGNIIAEIPEGVQIHVHNELSTAKNKAENRVVRSAQIIRDASSIGDETGIFHLQGRARENKSVFTQKGQSPLKEFFEFEADSGASEKKSFSSISKNFFAEPALQSSPLHLVVKEKRSLTHAIVKSDDIAAFHSELGKESLVKNSSSVVLAKPLPVSDENLMEQIKSGMARQVPGRQTVTIRLWPESMGKVDVKLVLREQQLSATFMVEQSDVKDAMLRKIDSLRDSLGVRGIDVKHIDIRVSPTKFGDGPSVMVGDQRQDSSETWQQYRQGEFAQSKSGSEPSSRGEGRGKDESLLSGTLANAFGLDKGIGGVPGSLHITA